MIEFLRTHIPTTAFDIIELDLWKRMYLYANKQGTYTAVKRLDRRTKHTENTYLDFAKWILTNYADYSSNDRYFITGFLADCKNNGLVVSRTKIDDMLRYDLTRDCFSEGDFMALGLCTQAEQDEFFETMDIIKQAQKK
ncbi:MAG: hypothetical protein K2M36_06025 [Clostridia bacterium]|nr:hypothetical protein [Clostridia bacterium]